MLGSSWVGIGTCMFFAVTLMLCGVDANSPAADKPNIVIFQPDDLPFYWDDAPEAPPNTNRRDTVRNDTPHLDKIRSEGVVFARAYASSAMCAPSRYSVLTGRYASRCKTAQSTTASCDNSWTVTDVAVPKSKMDDEFDQTDNLQQALRAEGYTTGAVGKWHISTEGRDHWSVDKYDEQVQKAKDTGFDYVDGFYIANLDSDLPFSHNQEWITAKGLEFIEQAVDEGNPFFLYFNPTLPHSPSAIDALDVSVRETPAGTLDADPASDHPARESVAERAGGDRKTDRSVGATQVDDAAGALYAKLEALGVLDKTLFVVVMDHGMLGKSTLYEGGARIAMFARYPGGGAVWTAGTSYHNLVSNLDLAPTLLHLASGAGPAAGAAADGASLLELPLLTSEAEARTADSRALVVEMGKARAVVTQQWKLLASDIEGFADADSGAARSCQAEAAGGSVSSKYPSHGAPEELFDLRADAAEQTNLASSADPAVLAALQARLECHLDATAIGAEPAYKSCADPFAAPDAVATTGAAGSPATTPEPDDVATTAAGSTEEPEATPEPEDPVTTTTDDDDDGDGDDDDDDDDDGVSGGTDGGAGGDDGSGGAAWVAAVRAVVALPYTVGGFPTELFREGVAAAAGSAVEAVEVHSVEPAGARRGSSAGAQGVRERREARQAEGGRARRRVAGRMRALGRRWRSSRGEGSGKGLGGEGVGGREEGPRLRDEGVEVDFSVRVASVSAAEQVVAEGKLELEALNAALGERGVQRATAVKVAPSVVVNDGGEGADEGEEVDVPAGSGVGRAVGAGFGRWAAAVAAAVVVIAAPR